MLDQPLQAIERRPGVVDASLYDAELFLAARDLGEPPGASRPFIVAYRLLRRFRRVLLFDGHTDPAAHPEQSVIAGGPCGIRRHLTRPGQAVERRFRAVDDEIVPLRTATPLSEFVHGPALLERDRRVSGKQRFELGDLS